MTAANGDLFRMAAFAASPGGGNPAGVWVGESLPGPAEMQEIATDVGFSETAFVAPMHGRQRTIRYFSPEAEVSFCGHATIAAGAVIGRADGSGAYDLQTPVGIVTINVEDRDGAQIVALESVQPESGPIDDGRLAEILDTLNWAPDLLDPALAPALAYAGAWHAVIAVRERSTLASLDYDFDRLKRIMLDANLTTLQLICREHGGHFHARNPFPVGGVVEDPATGAAAAALGGYLRDKGYVATPARIEIDQGYDMGRPSRLTVDIPSTGGIIVSGTANDL